MKDAKTNELFSFERNYDLQEQEDFEMINDLKLKGIPLTKQQRMIDLERQLRAGTKNIYPNNLGVTGEVFRTHKIVSGTVKQLRNFIPGLDNQSKYVKDVRTICIVPVFGHVIEHSGKVNLVAIAQFINKVNGVITDHDIVSFFHCL